MINYLKSVLLGLLIGTQAFAGLPPTTLGGRTGQSTTFNFKTPNSQATKISGTTSLIETGNGNVLVNPDFEAGTAATSWTVTNSTPTTDTTNFISGKQSLQLSLSAQSGDLLTQSVATTGQVVGQNWEYTAYFKTSLTGVTFCALQNSLIVGSCLAVTPDGNWHPYTINYPASAVSNGWKVNAISSVTGTLNADISYVGPARNIGTVAQSYLFGSIFMPLQASCLWANAASTSYNSYVANASCPTYTTTGNAVAPSTNIPAITFNAMPIGTYVFNIPQAGYGITSFTGTPSEGICSYKLTDGTTTVGILQQDRSTSNSGSNMAALTGSFVVTTPITTSKTFQIQTAASASSGFNCSLDNRTGVGSLLDGIKIDVTYFPSTSQNVATVGNTPASWAGYVTGTWTGTTSATPGTFTDTTTATSTAGTQRGTATNMACSYAGGTTPAINCNLPKIGNYRVCAITSEQLAISNYALLRLIETNSGTVIVQPPHYVSTANNSPASASMCGKFNATSLTPQFKIQVGSDVASQAITVGFGTTTPSVEWMVEGLDNFLGAPILSGSITSNSISPIRHEWAYITGSATTPTILDQSGPWLSTTITRNAAGDYSFVISPVFNSTPRCWGQVLNPSTTITTAETTRTVTQTTSALRLLNQAITGGVVSGVDADYMIFCDVYR